MRSLRAVVFIALAAVGALWGGGCKKEKESLVLVDLSITPAAPDVRSLSVTVGDTTKMFEVGSGGLPTSYSLGVYVPASVTGSVTVTVLATGPSGCFGGTGTATIAAAGETTAPVTITLTPISCPGDAGTSTGGTTGSGGASGGSGGASGGSGGASGGSGGAGGGAGGTSGSGGTGGQTPDGGADGPPQVVDPPSLNNCTELNQFANTTTNWGITQPVFSPNGMYLATGDQSGMTKIWTVAGNTVTAEGHTLSSGTGGNMRPAFSPNGLLLVTGTTNGGLALWNVGGTWSKRGDFVGNPAVADASAVAFTPDSARVVVIDYDTMNLQTFAVATLQSTGVRTFSAAPASLAVAEATNGGRLWTAVGLADGHVTVYNLDSQGETLPPITAATASIDAVSLSHDGSLLATGASDGTGHIWNIALAGATEKTPSLNLGSHFSVNGIAFSPDGRTVVASVGYPVLVGIWDVATGQNRGTKTPLYESLGVTFNPRGNMIVAGEAFFGWFLVCAD